MFDRVDQWSNDVGQSSYHGPGLTQHQVKTFKLSESAACRIMTAGQILDLADHLHTIIRRRGACCTTLDVATYDPRAGGESRSWELQL